jgi:hypothetical protein
MRLSRFIFPLVVTALPASLVLTGCGDQEDPASKAEALLQPYEAAFRSPTGTVNATTAPVMIPQASAQSSGSASFGMSPQAYAAMNGSGSVTVDMGQLGMGASGTITEEYEANGGFEYVDLTYNHVCLTADGMQSCMDGDGAVKVQVSGGAMSVVMGADLTSRIGKNTLDVKFGMELAMSSAGTETKILVFDEQGDSFVVVFEGTTGAASGSVRVIGANGTFKCTLGADGASGSCTGAGSFSF